MAVAGRHLIEIKEGGPYWCRLCPWSWRNLYDLVYHLQYDQSHWTQLLSHSFSSSSVLKPLSSAAFQCNICSCGFRTLLQLLDHDASDEHRDACDAARDVQRHRRGQAQPQRSPPGAFRCELCDVRCSSLLDLACHNEGAKHAVVAQFFRDQMVDLVCCFSCQNIMVGGEASTELHFKTREHVRRINHMVFGAGKRRQQLEEDKNGVSIDIPVWSKDGRVHEMQAGQTSTMTVVIRNESAKVAQLLSVRTREWQSSEVSFGFANSRLMRSDDLLPQPFLKPILIQPWQQFSFQMQLKATKVGYVCPVLVFLFSHFAIARFITMLVSDEIIRSLAPSAPFKKPKPPDMTVGSKIVPGVRPAGLGAGEARLQRIPDCHVAPHVRALLEKGPESVLEEMLLGTVTVSGFASRFRLLLNAEEVQLEKEVRLYDMKAVTMLRSGNFLALSVPGLAERRPSVLVGDRAFAVGAAEAQRGRYREYEGFVHRVQQNQLLLHFAPSFHSSFLPNQQFNIRFAISRGLIKNCHLAVTLTSQYLPASILTPNVIPPLGMHPLPRISTISGSLNDKQRRAVTQILRRSAILRNASTPVSFLPPYVVFGPPGTGKTHTLIEAILQLHRKQDPSGKLLVCAPSNDAVDHMLKRLATFVERRHLLRIMAMGRVKEEVDPSLLDFCNFNDHHGCFWMPDLDKLKAAKIVLVTCGSAALMLRRGLPRGHFSHIFVDEAAHAIEPETLIPISCFLDASTNLVLAGDHKQLGPIVASQLAIDFGLGVSYLERIVSTGAIYARNDSLAGCYQEEVMTKLVENYRSHPKILELPSQLFYDSELIPRAEEISRSSLCSWAELPNRNEFPILFHGVVGKDEREESSPSFFNPVEAREVFLYVSKLRESRRQRVLLSEIGVVTPYKKQAQKIRTLLLGRGMAGVKVGTVEQFQGQERRVIIISTVRSDTALLPFDAVHHLGFTANPKRFNVAVTRAKQLLIVIGNPHVLAKDNTWTKFIAFCHENGAYLGCPLPDSISPQSSDDI